MYGEYSNGGITNIKPCNVNFLETILQVLVKLKKKIFNMMGDKNFYEGSSWSYTKKMFLNFINNWYR